MHKKLATSLVACAFVALPMLPTHAAGTQGAPMPNKFWWPDQLDLSVLRAHDARRESVRAMGVEVVGHQAFPDHHAFRGEEVRRLDEARETSGAEMVVTTDKDGVKLRCTAPPGVWTLRISLEVVEKQEWERVLLRGL